MKCLFGPVSSVDSGTIEIFIKPGQVISDPTMLENGYRADSPGANPVPFTGMCEIIYGRAVVSIKARHCGG